MFKTSVYHSHLRQEALRLLLFRRFKWLFLIDLSFLPDFVYTLVLSKTCVTYRGVTFQKPTFGLVSCRYQPPLWLVSLLHLQPNSMHRNSTLQLPLTQSSPSDPLISTVLSEYQGMQADTYSESWKRSTLYPTQHTNAQKTLSSNHYYSAKLFVLHGSHIPSQTPNTSAGIFSSDCLWFCFSVASSPWSFAFLILCHWVTK